MGSSFLTIITAKSALKTRHIQCYANSTRLIALRPTFVGHLPRDALNRFISTIKIGALHASNFPTATSRGKISSKRVHFCKHMSPTTNPGGVCLQVFVFSYQRKEIKMSQLSVVNKDQVDPRMCTVTVAAPSMELLTDATAINFATMNSGLSSAGFDSMTTGGAFPVDVNGKEIDGLTLNAPIAMWHRQFVIRGGM